MRRAHTVTALRRIVHVAAGASRLIATCQAHTYDVDERFVLRKANTLTALPAALATTSALLPQTVGEQQTDTAGSVSTRSATTGVRVTQTMRPADQRMSALKAPRARKPRTSPSRQLGGSAGRRWTRHVGECD
mmetsp:Transcript_85075/g.169958  ORF Transcript_85075/g.169958 Transcript_85075/m.169958 type:complete len:133 (-) Transcript_85075:739-1137(-)